MNNKKPRATHKRQLRVKLIFNPGSGAVGASHIQLMDVIRTMQAWKLMPEAFLVKPGCRQPAFRIALSND